MSKLQEHTTIGTDLTNIMLNKRSQTLQNVDILYYSIYIKCESKITVLEVPMVVSLRKVVTRREYSWGGTFWVLIIFFIWVLLVWVCSLCKSSASYIYLLYIHLSICLLYFDFKMVLKRYQIFYNLQANRFPGDHLSILLTSSQTAFNPCQTHVSFRLSVTRAEGAFSPERSTKAG